MGKIVPSYRMSVEWEIDRWKAFREALPSAEEKEAFDAIMDTCRDFASAGNCATNPIIFEPMAMSIMLAQKKLLELKHKLNYVLWQKISIEKPSKSPFDKSRFKTCLYENLANIKSNKLPLGLGL